jgi:hypothetical protein
LRLQEMLDLAKQTERKSSERVEPFPTPMGARWDDLSIKFTSDHRVRLTIKQVTQNRNYAEIGFEDRRGGGGKPDSAWGFLRSLAESAGRIEKPVTFKQLGWEKVEKQSQTVRRRLRKLFNIAGDPLPFEGAAYEARFQITLGRSIEH